MGNYHKGVIPDRLEPKMRELLQQRERFLRTLNEPASPAPAVEDPDSDEPIPLKAGDWRDRGLVLYSNDGSIDELPVPPAGTEVLLRFTSTPTLTSGDTLQLDHDFTPADSDSVLRLVSDGTKLRESGRSPDTITSLPVLSCPLTIKGNCVNALDVLNASSVQHFRVDTVNEFCKVGTTSQLIIGNPQIGGGSYSGFGFVMRHQGHFGITETGSGTWPIYIEAQGQVMIGNKSVFPTEPSIIGNPYQTQFEGSVGFLGGFAWDRTIVTADGGTTLLDIGGAVTYVAYRGAGQETIVLPPTSTSFGVAGSKPGAIVIVKDEVGLAGPAIDDIQVAGSGGATIDGAAGISLHTGAGAFLITDGTNWFQFAQ